MVFHVLVLLITYSLYTIAIQVKSSWYSTATLIVGIYFTVHYGLLGGIMVRASDLQSSGRGLDSRPGRYRAT